MQTISKLAVASLALIGAAAVPGVASAGHLDVGVGINLGGPAYYAPAPVYAAPPPPVYTYDPPVVYAPPPPVVYGPPVPVYQPYYYHHRCWWDNGYRVCR